MVIRVPDARSGTEGVLALDDRLLVLDFQAGNVEGFVEIHRRYQGLSKHICQRMLRDPLDVDEAVQETWIRVFTGLHRFNGSYALQPWISRIATNVSLDLLRARNRRPTVDGSETIEDHEPLDPAAGPEELLERLVERDLVISVLSTLPETHLTALVMREYDGRSHKEIAEVLEMTPSQAKALIHRAKGSFRRNWILAMTERGGLMGIAMLPLLWAAKVFEGGRRIAEKVGLVTQAAHASAPEVVTAAAAAPAAPVAASGIAERVVAAGMTLLVAGSVTVGAATIVKHRADRDQGERAAPAPVVPSPSVAPSPQAPVVVAVKPEKKAVKERHRGKDRKAADEARPAVAAAAVASPSPSATSEASPTTDPSSSPSAEPSPPPPPPAPPWSLTFSSSVAIGEPQLDLIKSRVGGQAGGDMLFSQTVSGPIPANKGRPAGNLYVDYWGSTRGSDGTAAFWIFLDRPEGRYRYDASAILGSLTQDDTGTTYVFNGTYTLTDWPGSADGTEATEGVPHEGAIALTLKFWSDRTSLYQVDLVLQDSAPSS